MNGGKERYKAVHNSHLKLFDEFEQDPLFQAPTKPIMYGGVTYNFFNLNIFINGLVYFISQNLFATLYSIAVIYTIGYLLCRKDPRIFDRLFARMALTPTVKNYLYWRCNSYRP